MEIFNHNNLILRQENVSDIKSVYDLVENAFKNVVFSDKKEHYLVENLRTSDAFIPQLSIVAEWQKQLVGYCLLTKVQIVNESMVYDSLALAPVAVHPGFQFKGIGRRLIAMAHNKAKAFGIHSIILLGDPKYYSKFGYQPASLYGIKLPFDVADEYCMVIELDKSSLKHKHGNVVYPAEFYF